MENKIPLITSQSRRNNEGMATKAQPTTYVSTSENPYMLSPPPEEVLESARRANKLSGSTPRPLASSLVTNGVLSDLQPSKRKRVVVRSVKDTPPRPSAAQAATTTPNPRQKKQTRYDSHSPTSSVFPDASAPAMLTNSTSESSAMNVDGYSMDFVDSAQQVKLKKEGTKAANATRTRKTTPIDLTDGRDSTSPSSRASNKVGNGKGAATTRKKTRAANKSAPTKTAQIHQLRIKTEPPEVDLNLLPPPPSPTDDPILLVGSPVRRKASTSPRKSANKIHATTRPVNLVDFEVDLDLESVGRVAGSSTESRSNAPGNAQETSVGFGSGPIMPVERKREKSSSSWSSPSVAFDFGGTRDSFDGSSSDWQSSPNNAHSIFSQFAHTQGDNGAKIDSDGWSDSEDDDTMPVSEGEGDFTGKFYVYKVKTKMDPPSSTTAMRMQEWGRPISPHPKRLFDGDSMTIEEQDEEALGTDGDDLIAQGIVSHPNGRKGLRLSELENIKFGQRAEHDTNPDQEEENLRFQMEISHDSLAEVDSGFKDTRVQVQEASLSNNIQFEVSKKSCDDLYETEVETPEVSMQYVDSSTNVAGYLSSAHLASTLDEVDIPVEDQEHDTAITDGLDIDGIESQDTLVRVEDEGDDSSDTEEHFDPSIVKIVSSDPAAAARAAAILKMHDYDMIERAKRQKRDRSLTYEEQIRKMRRKSALEAGIRKATPHKRRKTIGSFSTSDFAAEHIPLTELLQEAEQSLRKSTPMKSTTNLPTQDHFSPHQRMSSVITENELPLVQPGPREWTKTDWKLLDSCFTDERRLFAERKGLQEGSLVEVDEIDLENVVERFAGLMGGEAMLSTFGQDWHLDRILRRALALRKKQKAGRGAPPTPSKMGRTSRASSAFYSPSSSNASMIVPDFTPTPVERLRQFPHFKSGRLFPSMSQTPQPQQPSQLSESSLPKTPIRETFIHREESPIDPDRELMPPPPLPAKVLEPPPSAVRRSINYLTSWLRPTPSKPVPPKSRIPVGPVLPLPPQEVLERHRGPVSTPKKKPAEKIVHPKETVELHPAPQPPSRIPKLLSKVRPQRLVDLKHVTPPQEEKLERRIVSRKSSTSSVKDLIQNFEKMEEQQRRHTIGSDLRRVQSFDSMKAKSIGKKPTWRP